MIRDDPLSQRRVGIKRGAMTCVSVDRELEAQQELPWEYLCHFHAAPRASREADEFDSPLA